MRYEILKELPGMKVGTIISDLDGIFNRFKPEDYPDFFAPLPEMKP